jgi:hypothetical protein
MPRKSKKAPEDLERAFVERVEKTVNILERQYGKLQKAVHSRKYKLSDAQIEKMTAYVNGLHDDWLFAMQGSQKAEETKFKL